MPIAQYDRYFGGAGKGGAQKALASMMRGYGKKKGTSVFYAVLNERKKKLAQQLAAKR